MKTYVSDIIPKIQTFSRKLDDLTLLSNRHWIVVDDTENEKYVYIFRSNGVLLISRNWRVEKGHWEYLDKNSILIDRKKESLLFRHGFLDENILALRVDGNNQYVFLLNESIFKENMNSIDDVTNYLKIKYNNKNTVTKNTTNNECVSPSRSEKIIANYSSNKGVLTIEIFKYRNFPKEGDEVLLNNNKPVNGRYRIGFMWYLYIVNGRVSKVSWF